MDAICCGGGWTVDVLGVGGGVLDSELDGTSFSVIAGGDLKMGDCTSGEGVGAGARSGGGEAGAEGAEGIVFHSCGM